MHVILYRVAALKVSPFIVIVSILFSFRNFEIRILLKPVIVRRGQCLNEIESAIFFSLVARIPCSSSELIKP